jgi:hypothetical protein
MSVTVPYSIRFRKSEDDSRRGVTYLESFHFHRCDLVVPHVSLSLCCCALMSSTSTAKKGGAAVAAGAGGDLVVQPARISQNCRKSATSAITSTSASVVALHTIRIRRTFCPRRKFKGAKSVSKSISGIALYSSNPILEIDSTAKFR